MAQTLTFTVDAIGNDEAVVAQSNCYRITIFENDQAGTVDYTVRRPDSGSPAVTIPAGAKYVFERLNGETYLKGQTVGFVATVSGSFTMAQNED